MRRHELDVFSLVTGLVFVVVAAGHILDEASQVDFDGRWVVPLVMVAIGVASLAGLARGRGRDHAADADARTTEDEPVGAAEHDEADTDETLVLHREEPEDR